MPSTRSCATNVIKTNVRGGASAVIRLPHNRVSERRNHQAIFESKDRIARDGWIVSADEDVLQLHRRADLDAVRSDARFENDAARDETAVPHDGIADVAFDCRLSGHVS